MSHPTSWYTATATNLGFHLAAETIVRLQTAVASEAIYALVIEFGHHILHFLTQEQSNLYHQHAAALENTAKTTKAMKIPELKPVSASKRRLVQPVFKIQFDTLEQAQLRLSGSLIFIGADLYYIQAVHKMDNNDTSDFLLVTSDHQDRQGRIWYSDPAVDLRAPEPQYIMYSGQPAFMTRLAKRQQRQGLDRSNTGIKYIGETRFQQLDRTADVMRAFRHREPVLWDAKLYDLMARARAITGLRLSERVAVGIGDDEIFCEYKGRPLGVLNENVVTVAEESDYKQAWIRKDLSELGLEARHK